MSGLHNIKMTSTVSKEELLNTLRKNLIQHQEIFLEATRGYQEKARKLLLQGLRRLKKGEVFRLDFDLRVPQDHSETYRTAISMLEWNKDETVSLTAQEFRQLVLDQWDWQSDFLGVANFYGSGKATAKLSSL